MRCSPKRSPSARTAASKRLQVARLANIKTRSGIVFSFQPSLDRNRVAALAALGTPGHGGLVGEDAEIRNQLMP